MSMYIGEKEIRQLKDGNWEHLAGQMIIKKRDNTEEIKGPGFIRQIQQKYFQIVIFNLSSTGGDKENLLKLLAGDRKKSGEIIPASEGYELETQEGWKSKNLTSLDSYYTPDGTIYITYTREIFYESKQNSPKAKAGVSYRAFHEYKGYPANKPILHQKYIKGDKSFPGWNLCVADTKSWLYDLRFFVHDGESVLQLISNRGKKHHNDKIEFRSVEAIEYVLGEPFEWNIKTVWDSVCRREHIRLVIEHSKSHFNRPYCDIWAPGSGSFEMFWGLYSNYLKYILNDKRHDFCVFGVMLKRLMGLRTASTEFSSYILALCVAVENLLLEHFAQNVQDHERKILVNKLQSKIKTFLRNNTNNNDLAEMVKNHISRLMPGKETPKRTLDRLIDENKISRKRKDAWVNLRHKVTHGRYVAFNQTNLNSVGDVEVLLHQLIFQCICYHGKYIDYGEIGYPRKKYPEEL